MKELELSGFDLKGALRLISGELKAAGIENADNEARWICRDILNLSGGDFILNEKVIDEKSARAIAGALSKRKTGFPLLYILGRTKFCGFDFLVRENVLIPRNDTEILVEKAVGLIGERCADVLDMCAGSGVIGISVKKLCPKASVSLLDISDCAIELIRDNARLNGADVEIIKSDMFENLKGRYDFLLANPPYIESEVLRTLDVFKYEPELALDGSFDGLKFYRSISRNVRKYLKPDGIVILEIGYDQAESAGRLFEDFKNIKVIKDLNGNDRLILCSDGELNV